MIASRCVATFGTAALALAMVAACDDGKSSIGDLESVVIQADDLPPGAQRVEACPGETTPEPTITRQAIKSYVVAYEFAARDQPSDCIVSAAAITDPERAHQSLTSFDPIYDDYEKEVETSGNCSFDRLESPQLGDDSRGYATVCGVVSGECQQLYQITFAQQDVLSALTLVTHACESLQNEAIVYAQKQAQRVVDGLADP